MTNFEISRRTMLKAMVLIGLDAAAGRCWSQEQENEKYPWHENIVASVFWVGERKNPDNEFIHNISSAWMTDWNTAFGGVDTPDNRNPQNPYYPAGFTPKENSFYAALPAAEWTEEGLVKGARESSPWANEPLTEGQSLFKNRWIEIVRRENGEEHSCYAQWEDVGPGDNRQYAYVFGNAEVQNDSKLGAGIDLSPASAIELGFEGKISQSSAIVNWRFIDEKDVPDGPWKEIVTASDPNW